MTAFTGPITTDWLCKALQADGQLSPQQATDARLRLSRSSSRDHPITRLARLQLQKQDQPGKILDAEGLSAWFADQVGLPYRKIDPLKVDIAAVTSVCSYAYAEKAGILPLERHHDKLIVAVSDPSPGSWERDLGQIVDCPIEKVICNPADQQRFLVEFYALAKSIRASAREQNKRQTNIQNLEHLTELSRRGNLEANDQHVVSVVDWLLQYAFEQRASDIHIEPRREQAHVRFRIDGQLHPVFQMPDQVNAAVCSRLKILARLDLAEKRRPQDGRIKTRSPDGEEIELRLSTMPSSFGEKLVLRIFNPDTLAMNFSSLGLSREQSEIWQDLISQPHGIVLVTGPTGSGKTTTLYSSLRQIASPAVNICTIEDPIELIEPQFNQMQVNRTLDVTFASGIRTLLRQDPDIIMVGEIRDLETAETAIQAALTGHLVLSTLHTNDACSALTRMLELGVPAYLLRATVLGVLAQRLARRLCPHCKTKAAVDQDEWIAMAGSERPIPKQIASSPGCLECRATGFLGRVGLYELFPVDATIRQSIQDKMDTQDLLKQARGQGMVSLREAGIQKVLAGQTHPREVLRLTPPI